MIYFKFGQIFNYRIKFLFTLKLLVLYPLKITFRLHFSSFRTNFFGYIMVLANNRFIFFTDENHLLLILLHNFNWTYSLENHFTQNDWLIFYLNVDIIEFSWTFPLTRCLHIFFSVDFSTLYNLSANFLFFVFVRQSWMLMKFQVVIQFKIFCLTSLSYSNFCPILFTYLLSKFFSSLVFQSHDQFYCTGSLSFRFLKFLLFGLSKYWCCLGFCQIFWLKVFES